MKINKLRQIVSDYDKFGLPITKRKFIQKQIGYSKASDFIKELDSFIKSDECKFVVSPLFVEKYNDKHFLNLYIVLDRTKSLFKIFSELETKSIQNTLEVLKKIKNIRPNKIKNNIFNQEIKSDYKIEKATFAEFCEIKDKWIGDDNIFSESAASLKYYKINEGNNNPVAFFSLYEDFLEYEIADFMVEPNKRKTKSLVDIIKIIRQVVNTDKPVCCGVLALQPELVKMYEKCGFRLMELNSDYNSERKEIITAFIMKNHK